MLVDWMRGRSSTWTRIRVICARAEKLRPAQETPDPDDDPTRAASGGVRVSFTFCAAHQRLAEHVTPQRALITH
jgi:hypothetical protein